MPAKTKPKFLDAPWSPSVVKWISNVNTWLYERSGGRWGGTFLGAPVMLLTTTGRKSGRPRTKPLLYMRDGDRVICVASKAGMATHPLWYRNLIADPRCTVQIGSATEQRTARVATDEERAELWPKLLELYADFESYASWTDRQIPVVILEA